MPNIQPVGATRLADVHVANNENNSPISTVDGKAIVTDSRLIDEDNLSKQCTLLQNVKTVKSTDDVMKSIQQSQVEGKTSRCYISIEGNGMNNRGHGAFNIIDLLNIHLLAKDLANLNHNSGDQYYLALQIISESLEIMSKISETKNSSIYIIETTNDNSITTACSYLTNFIKVRKNIGKIKKLLSKIQNKEQRENIKRDTSDLLEKYLVAFHLIYNTLEVGINTIKSNLSSEKYYSYLLESLQIRMTILNQDCDLQNIISERQLDNIITSALADCITSLCHTLTTIVFYTNETHKAKALSMILEEKNKQLIKKSLDNLNNSPEFESYSVGKVEEFTFLFYNLINMIFGNTKVLNKQIKLFRDSCNIYDSFPEKIIFDRENIEDISSIYNVILNFSIFSELTGDGIIDIDGSLEFYKLMSLLFYIGKYYNAFNSTFPDTVYGAEACPKYQEFISLMKIDHQKLTEYSNLLENMLVILESNTEIKLDNFSAELPPVIFSCVNKMVDDYNKDQSLINKNSLINELKKIIAKLSFINNEDLHTIQNQTNSLKQIKKQYDELKKEEEAKIEAAKIEAAKKPTKKPKKIKQNFPTTKPASKPKPSVAIEYDKPPIKTKTIFENDENTTIKLQQLEVITASKNKVEALAAKLVSFIYRLEQVQLVKPNDTPEESENIRKMNSDIRQNKKFDNFAYLINLFETFNPFENLDFIFEDIKELLDMNAENKLILQKNDFCKQIAEELKKIILDKQEEYNNSVAQLTNIHKLFETIPTNQRQSKYKMSQETINKCLSMNNVFKNVPVYMKNILSFLNYVNNNTQQTSKK